MKPVASAVVERWFSPAFRQKAPATISNTQKMLEETNPEGYVACCAAVRDFDCRDQLSSIRMPALVIAGAHDPATPPADGRFVADQIPGARYIELNAAHLSNIEEQDRFNSEISRSEEHTSELQSLTNLVCRLLLEKKKNADYVHEPTR